jgi:hypothetical protein
MFAMRSVAVAGGFEGLTRTSQAYLETDLGIAVRPHVAVAGRLGATAALTMRAARSQNVA